MATSLLGPAPSVRPLPARIGVPVLAAGEFVSFLLPVAVGLAAHAAGMDGLALWGVIVAAGLGHGLLLGAAQAPAVHHAIPSVNRALWVAATGVTMAVAWAFAWLAPTYYEWGEPTGITAGIALVAITVNLLAAGVPQAEVLSAAKVRYSHVWTAFAVAIRALGLAPVGIAAFFIDWHAPSIEIFGALAVAAAAQALIAASITNKALLRMARFGLREVEQG